MQKEGIIHWSNMEIIAQTVKGAYLQRRRQRRESSNHVSVGRLVDLRLYGTVNAILRD